MGMLDAGDFAGFCLRQQRIGTRRHLTHCRRGSTFNGKTVSKCGDGGAIAPHFCRA
jgi:hypothetical protein